MTRYAGKPFLKVIEAFILDAIGELPVEQRNLMQQMAARLQEIDNRKSSWQDIVTKAMQWEPNAAANIRHQWTTIQELARVDSAVLLPSVFARQFADAIIENG